LDEACTGQACAVADAAQLAAFLRLAAASGVRVWAVAGDPRAVLPEERAAWIGRAAAYRQFNLAQPPAARLAGVQYDIEAYLVPGYGEDPAGWNQRYVDLLRRLREAGGSMAMDVVVPWWFGRGGDSPAELLTALQPLVDILTVMDYRTDGDQLVQAAVPFVAWAQHGGRQVRIALESGPLPDLEARRYEAAEQGELLLLELGNQAVYALLATPLAAGPRAQVFARRGGHLVKAAQTTFAGRPEALRLAVLHLEDAFAATRAFAGVAIHGLDQAWY
ncbi:MAG: hypothetical protein KGI67_13110, partial [Pseudomonadota bacterium]|nr:hypothetical protein [Pseudomonadota bacterium]